MSFTSYYCAFSLLVVSFPPHFHCGISPHCLFLLPPPPCRCVISLLLLLVSFLLLLLLLCISCFLFPVSSSSSSFPSFFSSTFPASSCYLPPLPHGDIISLLIIVPPILIFVVTPHLSPIPLMFLAPQFLHQACLPLWKGERQEGLAWLILCMLGHLVVGPTSLKRGEGLLTVFLHVVGWEWWWRGQQWWWWDERRQAKSTMIWLMVN